MRRSRLHAPTLREAPRDARTPADQWLTRAGYQRLVVGACGPVDLPLCGRVLDRIDAVLTRSIGSQAPHQVSMIPSAAAPATHRLKGALDRPLADVLVADLRSYKELPRAFVSLRQTVARERLSVALVADVAPGEPVVGARRGFEAALTSLLGSPLRGLTYSEEESAWVLPHEGGEHVALACLCVTLAAADDAPVAAPAASSTPEARGPVRRVDTPGAHSVADVAAALQVRPVQILKTIVVETSGPPVVAVIRGDRTLSLSKLAGHLGDPTVRLARDAVVEQLTGAPVGFAGPVGLDAAIHLDMAVDLDAPYVVGANAHDAHLVDVVPRRDLPEMAVVDLIAASPGDRCARCGGSFGEVRGTIVATSAIHAPLAGRDGAVEVDGAGGARATVHATAVSWWPRRLMNAVVATRLTDRGLVWPAAIAPFDLLILSLGRDGDAASAAAERLYEQARARHVRALLDDRDHRAGAKFTDAALTGVRHRIAIGRRSVERGMAEWTDHRSGDTREVAFEAVIDAVLATTEAP